MPSYPSAAWLPGFLAKDVRQLVMDIQAGKWKRPMDG